MVNDGLSPDFINRSTTTGATSGAGSVSNSEASLGSCISFVQLRVFTYLVPCYIVSVIKGYNLRPYSTLPKPFQSQSKVESPIGKFLRLISMMFVYNFLKNMIRNELVPAY
jgi:hypothetical protein